MVPPSFEYLLESAQKAHGANPTLFKFCHFPNDLRSIEVTPRHIPAADLLLQERGFDLNAPHSLREASIAASSDARWRETYWETDIAQDFKDRFGCYCMIGEGGGWLSDQMSAYVVYMPAGLYYPWHQHPAEELYYIIGGEVEFMNEGLPTQTLRTGQSSFHAANKPHAMQTKEHPVMAYVLWRTALQTTPVWSDPSQT